MRFDPLEEALDDNLVLPIKGADGQVREYTIAPATAERWVRLAALKQVQQAFHYGRTPTEGDTATVLSMSQRSMLDDSLGADVAQAMLDDGVSATAVRRAGATALIYHIEGADAALAAWSGKAASPKTPSAKGGGGDRATSTASTPGTSTRRRSPRR